MKKINIDWPNQIVGFVSTIVGIIIALQLQDWYTYRSEQRKVEETIKVLQGELKSNKNIIEQSIQFLIPFAEVSSAISAFQKTDSTIVCPRSVYDSLRRLYPENFPSRKINGNPDEHPFHIELGFLLEELHFSSWDAVRSTGLLNSFPGDRIVPISRTYESFKRNFSDVEIVDFTTAATRKTSIDNVKQMSLISKQLLTNLHMKLRLAGFDLGVVLAY